MTIDDETDDAGGNGHDYSPVDEIDLFGAAIALCQVAQRAKTVEAALKRLRKIGRDTLVAEQKLANVEARAADTAAALAEREAELDAREAAITKREAALESQAGDVRDELYAHHNRIAAAHRRLVHRIMSTAGIAGNWNFDLQDPPTWEQLRRMIADLPDDPTPAAEVVTKEVTTDWTGQHSFIAGSSLTRSAPS
jgi:hypothetical protein